MSGPGCGAPLAGPSALHCGAFTTLHGATVGPYLCPTCQGARTLARVGLAACEGCGERPATSEGPRLCATCRAEYAADLAAIEAERGTAGARCSSRCGFCGRCGDA